MKTGNRHAATGKSKKAKIVGFALCAVLFALGAPAQAQQPNRVPRIGYLSGSSLSVVTDRIEAFRRGLRELGYIEGKNIFIEWRAGEGKQRAMATELMRLKVEIIVAAGGTEIRAAKEATTTIPIVMIRGG